MNHNQFSPEQAIRQRAKYANHLQNQQNHLPNQQNRLPNHLRDERSAEQRMERFEKLQRASFEVLFASPDGYQNFLRRNFRSRRVEVVHEKYRPVSSARRAQ